MARIARVVVPGLPHHLTQRGNRRQETFFCPEDYQAYRQLLAQWCSRYGVEVWAYCLMPNHVHLIAVPSGRRIGDIRSGSTFGRGGGGHLWQGRFASFPMDDAYLLAAARYVELNPVRAGLVEVPEAYPWSSASAHLAERDDGLVRVAPLLARVGDWREFMSAGLKDEVAEE